MVHSRRLNSVVAAAIRVVDPDYARRIAKRAERGVRTGGDEFDPLTGWVSARLDRADAIYLDATVQYLADILATQGDVGTVDERRAKGLGILANPAQAIQMVGVHTTRGMNPIPVTVADKQVFVEVAKTLAPVFTPRTQVYVHLCADTLGDPEAVARIEKIGPVLAEQISKITQASRVRVTPVLHMNDTTIAVDAYEIPTQIREQVLLRQPHDCFPWSPTESRHLDLDHTIPYQPGVLGQTNPANLSPLSRKAHRAKTHAGWTLTQPSPGVYNWLSPAGQEAQVDQTGTHPPPSRE
jgi:hypothetical protein